MWVTGVQTCALPILLVADKLVASLLILSYQEKFKNPLHTENCITDPKKTNELPYEKGTYPTLVDIPVGDVPKSTSTSFEWGGVD